MARAKCEIKKNSAELLGLKCVTACVSDKKKQKQDSENCPVVSLGDDRGIKLLDCSGNK